MEEFQHITVLKDETIKNVLPREELVKHVENSKNPELLFVDATLGGGGHAAKLIELFQEDKLLQKLSLTLIGCDRDPAALAHANRTLQGYTAQYPRFTFHLFHDNFSNLKQIFLKNFPEKKIHGLYADFGVSSPQLDLKERGFSFLHNGPVDMRMNPQDSLTARQILETYSEERLTAIFFDFGEEPKSKKLARAIVQDRKNGTLPLSDTKSLAEYIKKILAYPHSRTHPATRAFQALRIEVNRELEAIQSLLNDVPDIIHPLGKSAFISFHSLEDRLVKRAMRNWQKGKKGSEDKLDEKDYHHALHFLIHLEENHRMGFGRENPRGGIVPGEEECKKNIRARSARLRVFEFAMDE